MTGLFLPSPRVNFQRKRAQCPLLYPAFLTLAIDFVHPRPPHAFAVYYMELHGRCDSCAIREAFRKDLSIGTDPPHIAYTLFVPQGLTQQQKIGVFQRHGLSQRSYVDDNQELLLAVPKSSGLNSVEFFVSLPCLIFCLSTYIRCQLSSGTPLNNLN